MEGLISEFYGTCNSFPHKSSRHEKCSMYEFTLLQNVMAALLSG